MLYLRIGIDSSLPCDLPFFPSWDCTLVDTFAVLETIEKSAWRRTLAVCCDPAVCEILVVPNDVLAGKVRFLPRVVLTTALCSRLWVPSF